MLATKIKGEVRLETSKSVPYQQHDNAYVPHDPFVDVYVDRSFVSQYPSHENKHTVVYIQCQDPFGHFDVPVVDVR